MAATISAVIAQEIIDSRDNPTVEAEVRLNDGTSARASVPSGASTGSHEALELRDNDPQRFGGMGVLQAVANVNEKIAPALVNQSPENQTAIDQIMLELDGTDAKSNLGANAILAVSMAVARAAAESKKIPLYQHIAELHGAPTDHYLLPVPMMNVLNGGKHAVGSTDMQEYMIMPIGAMSFSEAVRWGTEVFDALADILKERGFQTTVGDEGGFAPPLKRNEEPLELIMQAIQAAGYEPGKDISIAQDPAASEFYHDGKYTLATENKQLTASEMIDLYSGWLDKYPIISLEDGLAEDDWDGWVTLTEKLGSRLQLVGDDLFVTNPERLRKGIELKAANSILVKINQIGSISETLQTIKMAQEANYKVVVSHRSGETEDTFIADLAVGAGASQIKTGSLSRSERTAKYNQLMRIERELGDKATMSKMSFAQH